MDTEKRRIADDWNEDSSTREGNRSTGTNMDEDRERESTREAVPADVQDSEDPMENKNRRPGRENATAGGETS